LAWSGLLSGVQGLEWQGVVNGCEMRVGLVAKWVTKRLPSQPSRYALGKFLFNTCCHDLKKIGSRKKFLVNVFFLIYILLKLLLNEFLYRK